MTRLERIQERSNDFSILPAILGATSKRKLKAKDRSKVEIFEKGLANELAKSDTIETSVEKIVKMALACEFGPSLVAKPGAKQMIETISRGIMSDSNLRRSALIIVDRFASSMRPTKKIEAEKSTSKGRKKILNG